MTSDQQPNPQQHHDEIPRDLPKAGTLRMILVALTICVLLAALFVVGLIPNHRRLARLEERSKAAQEDRPIVTVDQPKRSAQKVSLTLPGDSHAAQETAIFARTAGYLKRQLVDIGDHVQAGQLLAEIDSPEVDAQLNQERAALQQARANAVKAQNDFELAQSTYMRYEGFAKSGGVTQQQLDEKKSDLNQAQSNLEAFKAAVAQSQASVQRLESLQGFEKISAPFAGTITARGYDVGALISPIDSGPGRQLFSIAALDPLLVYVKVPQTYSTQVKIGQDVEFSVRNYADRVFKGAVTRSTGVIDPGTRTLLMELSFPNPDGLLTSGMYGQVRFEIEQNPSPLVVPTSALVYNADGLQVGVVRDEKVYFQKINVGRDFGTEVEVLQGLSGTEQIVANPGVRLSEGTAVKVANDDKARAQQPQTASAQQPPKLAETSNNP